MKYNKKRLSQMDRQNLKNIGENNFYFTRLMEIAISIFKWQNLPETIDSRYLELTLFRNGVCCFFRDDVIGDLALQCAVGGKLNVYNVPTRYEVVTPSGYFRALNEKNAVLIWNNLLHLPSNPQILDYAARLTKLDNLFDVNVNAQKTPILIKCDEKQRLTFKNLYLEYDGNSPVIFGDKSLDLNGFQVLKTDAPFLGDKILDLKNQIWNEALTYLGVTNVNFQKKERMIVDEVNRLQGGVIASRASRLKARQQACEKINKMFGLKIWVEYNDDLVKDIDNTDTNETEPESDGEGGVDE